jgi:hypothetical protein
VRPVFLFLVLSVFLPFPCLGRTWHVAADGSGDAPSVQAGIDSAAVGDTVLVDPGRYYENIDFNGKDIVLQSAQGPDVTILDGSHGNASVVAFHSAEGRGAVLEGFTVTGGRADARFSRRGGGIVCTNASPIIRGNYVVQNEAPDGSGGGVAVGTGLLQTPTPAPLIEGNLIESNSSTGNGGGLDVRHGQVIIRANMIRDNVCSYDGGGMYGSFVVGSVAIEGNQFWGNHAGDHGGGIHLAGTPGAEPMTIDGNLFVRNIADGLGTGDTGSGGAIRVREVSGEISHNTMVANGGSGESACSGGGLLLDNTSGALSVHGNLIAFNDGCGVACKNNIETVLGSNLLWENTEGDLGTGPGHCPEAWQGALIIADPLFCDPDADNFTVAKDSPALTGPEIMGVWAEPGCGPGVPVERTTWGQIKARYE